MKKLITLIFLVYANLVAAQTEKYYVTYVKGFASVKNTNKPIKVGDVLLSTDALVFKDNQAKISCISPGKGRFDISAQTTKAGPTGELLAQLKSNLVPANKSYHLSSRSLLFEGYDPKTYFQSLETDNRILLLMDELLTIAPSYKMDNAHFFFIQYVSNGQTIIKKIEQTEKGLLFKPNLFSEGNPKKVLICYQKQVEGKAVSNILTEFIPVIAYKTDLLTEISVLKMNVGDDKKLLIEAVTAHIFDNYGKLSVQQIDELLSNPF